MKKIIVNISISALIATSVLLLTGCLSKSNELETIERQHRLALDYLKMKDYPNAFEIFHRLDEQGDTWAQMTLGWCYGSGDGVGKDSVKAVEWYRKAAEKGYDVAQSLLANCYAYGIGVEQDLDEALKWFQKVIEQGPSIHAAYAPSDMEALLGMIEYWRDIRRDQIQQIDDRELLMQYAEEAADKYVRQLAKERLEELENPKEASHEPEKTEESEEVIFLDF